MGCFAKLNKSLVFGLLSCFMWCGQISVVDICTAQEAPVVNGVEDRLQIGAKAPPLDIEHWLPSEDENAGDRKPITKFVNGHVYVVEFWGTWCGACISDMPELVEIQKEFADQVTVIDVTDEELPDVNAFLDKNSHHDQSMTYRSLTSPLRIAADPDGSVFNDYMKGIERRSFPMLAIVGKTGMIEFIGSNRGLRNSLKKILADEWDRDYIRFEQIANWKARKVMMKINDLRRDGKIDEAIDVLDLAVEEADQSLRSASYEFQNAFIPGKNKSAEELEKLRKKLNAAATENQRWFQNRFSFLLKYRSLESLDAFNQMKQNYASSVNDRLNLAWQVFIETTEGTKVDKRLIKAATGLAKEICDSKPENATCLDVYAHLLYASGEHENCIKVFKEALKFATDDNREEIESDYKHILGLIGM